MNEWIIPIVVAIIAAAPGLFALRGQFKRDNADAASRYQEMLEKEIAIRKAKTKECRELSERVKELENHIEYNVKYIRKLKAYIELTGGEVPSSSDTTPRRKRNEY